MPELPEVEIVRRGIEQSFEHEVVSSVTINRPDIRVPITKGLAAALAGRELVSLKRRGKYIAMIFDGALPVILHLGMSGRIRIHQSNDPYTPEKHDHVIFHFENGASFAFQDPRRFGMLYCAGSDDWLGEKPFSNMGPEPLNDWSEAQLTLALKNKKSPIKTALLDQKVVSGLGNIYVCEALFISSISPLSTANSITANEAKRIIIASKSVLQDAIKSGGSTLKDHRQTDGSLGYFQHQFKTYGRDGQKCVNNECEGEIIRVVQAGRSTFYCPSCQK